MFDMQYASIPKIHKAFMEKQLTVKELVLSCLSRIAEAGLFCFVRGRKSRVPSMTVPIGQKQDKLPMGSYWIARRFDEAALLRVGYAVEQVLGLRLELEIQ